MTAMFPDSGVPASDAKNSLLDPNTINCIELWYSTSRCQPRFDPAAANAMLAELLNLIARGEVVYDCTRFDNIERAARYLVQRGIPRGAYAAGGGSVYTLAMDPTLTRYNNFLTLTIVPAITNTTVVRVNIDNLGLVPVLRNDGQELQAKDWTGGVPTIIAYWNGYFFNVGFVASQVPPGPLTAPLDLWVNNAFGNDNNDGHANDPAHALATFQRAINIAFSYQPGPYPVNVHIMAGTYAGAYTPIYPGPSLNITGQGASTMIDAGGGTGKAFSIQGPNNGQFHDIAVRGNGAPLAGGVIVAGAGASLTAKNIYAYGMGGSSVYQSTSNASLYIGATTYYGSAWSLFWANFGGYIGYLPEQQTIAAAIGVTQANMFCQGGASIAIPQTTPEWQGAGNISGPRYIVGGNGMVQDQTAIGNWFPGSVPGSTDTGGQYL
ncbi:hypothetical protein [Bradyrhizobium sp. USDA 10063]